MSYQANEDMVKVLVWRAVRKRQSIAVLCRRDWIARRIESLAMSLAKRHQYHYERFGGQEGKVHRLDFRTNGFIDFITLTDTPFDKAAKFLGTSYDIVVNQQEVESGRHE